MVDASHNTLHMRLVAGIIESSVLLMNSYPDWFIHIGPPQIVLNWFDFGTSSSLVINNAILQSSKLWMSESRFYWSGSIVAIISCVCWLFYLVIALTEPLPWCTVKEVITTLPDSPSLVAPSIFVEPYRSLLSLLFLVAKLRHGHNVLFVLNLSVNWRQLYTDDLFVHFSSSVCC